MVVFPYDLMLKAVNLLKLQHMKQAQILTLWSINEEIQFSYRATFSRTCLCLKAATKQGYGTLLIKILYPVGGETDEKKLYE